MDADLAPQLRRHHIDALSVYDIQQPGLLDEAVLDYAARHGRVLLTHNIRHFVALYQRYLAEARNHAGIVLTNEPYIGRLLDRLLPFVQTTSAEEMINQIRFL